MLYKVPSPVLKSVCKEVEEITDKHKEYHAQMRTAMYMNQGVGLAANQIGLPIRMFIWDAGKPYKDTQHGKGVIINPILSGASVKKVTDQEGCLSIPGKWLAIERPTWVSLQGLDLEGNKQTIFAEGYLARIFQHEMDHLNGICILDRV